LISTEKEKYFLDRLAKGVVEFNEEEVRAAVEEGLANGLDPQKAIFEGLLVGMQKVGELYEKLEYFVPELLMCSDALNVGLDILKPRETIISVVSGLGEGIVYVGAGYNNVLPAVVRGVDLVYPADFSPHLPSFSQEDNEDFIRQLDKLEVKDIWNDPLINAFILVAEEVRSSLKDNFVIAPLTWGPFTLAGQLISPELLMRKIIRSPEIVNTILDFAIEVVHEFYRPFVEKKLVDMIYLPEPLMSGDMISYKLFDKFAKPVLERFFQSYKILGLPTMVHICGILTTKHLEILNDIKGLDVISIDSKVPLKNARLILQDKCIAGNFDTLQLDQASEEEIIVRLGQMLEEMEGHSRYIVMPACDLSPSTPYSNVKTFFQYVRNYQVVS
jgi:MtaA/CmuA family methyltransferase